MVTTYPAKDTDTPDALLASMGTFWSTIFPAKQQLEDTLTSRLLVWRQVERQVAEAINAISRKTIDPLHTEPLLRLSILKSSLSRVDKFYTLADALPLDGGYQFDDGPATTQYVYLCIDIPPANIPVLQNTLKSPSRILVAGVDFKLEGSRLHFLSDPFADAEYNPQPVYDSQNSVSDYRIDLWGFQAQVDTRAVSRQVGYEIKLDVPPTLAGRDFVNAVMDLLVDGPTVGSLSRALSSALGAELAAGDEVVTVATTDRRGVFIATDRRIYRFNTSAAASVAVGDQLVAGQSLTNAFSIQALTPDVALPYLTVQPSMVDYCFNGPLTFENADKTLHITTVLGYTYVSWSLTGDTTDITNFFNVAHADGISRIGTLSHCGDHQNRGTIAQWLDNRVNPIGEPEAGNLPLTINPFRFLCENCLQGNAWLVKLRLASCNDNGIGLQYIAALRQFLPKQTALFFAVETSDQDDQIKEWLRDVTFLPAT